MPDILIIGQTVKQSTGFEPAEYTVEQLSTYDNQTTYNFCTFEEINFLITSAKVSCTETHNHRSIDTYDLIFLKNWFKSYQEPAFCLAMYADARKIPFLNPEARLGRSRSKLSQYLFMGLEGIPLPATFYGFPEAIYKFLDSDDFFGWPIILKKPGAARGEDNHLLTAANQVTAILKTDYDRYLVQEFIPNTHDLRILMYDGKAELIIKRERDPKSNSHLNNTSKGAGSELLPLNYVPAHIIEKCALVAKRFGRKLTGVDIIYNPKNGHFVVLEVNNMPQLATGAFVEKKLAILHKAIQQELINAKLKK